MYLLEEAVEAEQVGGHPEEDDHEDQPAHQAMPFSVEGRFRGATAQSMSGWIASRQEKAKVAARQASMR